MHQRWHDLLFAHWRIPHETLRPLVPPELELDIFDGAAWLGIVPFWMSDVRFRALPPIPSASTFPELNVRTYVRAPRQPDKPGVYFFSLDAASVLAVLGARAGAGLPYYWAEMRAEVAADDEVRYRSFRRQSPRPAELITRYRPTGPLLSSKSHLELFLTERYCLYVVRLGRVYRIEIHHLPWPLQPAEAQFKRNTMAAIHGIQLPDKPPLLHFAKCLDVVIFGAQQLAISD